MAGTGLTTFHSLYNDYGAGIYRYLLGQVRRVDVAEDLLQAVMLRVVRQKRKLRSLRAPRAWLFTIARNELRRHWGKQACHAHEELPLLIAPEDSDNEDLEALRAALARLQSERWEVVSLKVYQQLTFAEIGEVLGISPNTAASRYRYALEDLRRMLEKHDERD